jgi:hypothetical protein
MTRAPSLNRLWESVPSGERAFRCGQLTGLPEAARRYLEHAIAPGALLGSAVRLRMHGEVKLGRWLPFTAEQVIPSAAGRVMAESVWLPSVLCGNEVGWTAQDAFHPRASLTVQGEAGELALTIDDNGGLKTLTLPGWGNPRCTEFRYVDFGGVVEEESRFGAYTIPTRLRVGYYVGTDRFVPDGEFFRVAIDDAAHR